MKQPFHHLVRGILIKDQQVLIAQAEGYTNTFLPGGHIELGESAKKALSREFEEELGVSCNVGKFLGLVEHRWERQGVVHCEINQVFEITSDELQASDHPESEEAHLQFSWCHIDDLEKQNLQPYPFRQLIKNYVSGNQDTWWESTLNSEIDELNRN